MKKKSDGNARGLSGPGVYVTSHLPYPPLPLPHVVVLSGTGVCVLELGVPAFYRLCFVDNVGESLFFTGSRRGRVWPLLFRGGFYLGCWQRKRAL